MICNLILSDVIISLTTAISVTLVTYSILYSMRPKLVIESINLNSGNLRITIDNQTKKSVENFRIEVCGYSQTSRFTYHFKLDFPSFLMLPSKQLQDDTTKTFQTNSILESTVLAYGVNFDYVINEIKNNNLNLRVRFHANHSISGLGKSFQEIYKWDGSKFVKVDR